jgi:hypothetical protein
VISIHRNDRLINDILGQSQWHSRPRPSSSKTFSHPTAKTGPGADQLRVAPPASTNDPLTDAQIHAIIVNMEINHSKFE